MTQVFFEKPIQTVIYASFKNILRTKKNKQITEPLFDNDSFIRL